METPMGTLLDNKFVQWALESDDVCTLPTTPHGLACLHYLVEVYMDDYFGRAIPTTQDHLRHTANAVMHGIHDVFPAAANGDKEPFPLKTYRREMGRGSYKKTFWASRSMARKRHCVWKHQKETSHQFHSCAPGQNQSFPP
jgi:hypothetical protein